MYRAILFSAGAMTGPVGERGRLPQRINIQPSKLNNNELSRATKVPTALTTLAGGRARAISCGHFPPHSQQRFVLRKKSPSFNDFSHFPNAPWRAI
jgi:hypothetical protein